MTDSPELPSNDAEESLNEINPSSSNQNASSMPRNLSPADIVSTLVFNVVMSVVIVYTGYQLYNATNISGFCTAYFATGFPLTLASFVYIGAVVKTGIHLPEGSQINPLKAGYLISALGTVIVTTPICWYYSSPVGEFLATLIKAPAN